MNRRGSKYLAVCALFMVFAKEVLTEKICNAEKCTKLEGWELDLTDGQVRLEKNFGTFSSEILLNLNETKVSTTPNNINAKVINNNGVSKIEIDGKEVATAVSTGKRAEITLSDAAKLEMNGTDTLIWTTKKAFHVKLENETITVKKVYHQSNSFELKNDGWLQFPKNVNLGQPLRRRNRIESVIK